MTKGTSNFFPAIGTKFNSCHAANSGQFCSGGGGGGGGIPTEYIQSVSSRVNYPGTIPSKEKQEETISQISTLDKITNKKIVNIADKVGVSEGFALHIADIVKSDIAAGRATGSSNINEGLVRRRDSSGRAIPRRLGG